MTGRERLTAAAAAIMACPLPERNFIRTNCQRQTALVVAGHKPASEIHLFGPDAKSQNDCLPVALADSSATEAWMDRVGLLWRLIKEDIIECGSDDKPWAQRVIYATALDTTALDRMETLWRHNEYPTDLIEHGRLSGFPDTAIEAFAMNQASFGQSDRPPELTDEPIMATVQFRFSRAHWREELAEVRPWVDEIGDSLPRLYAELEKLNAQNYR